MSPADQTEMPWSSCPIQIGSRLLEDFRTFRSSNMREALRGRMPIVENFEVRFENVVVETQENLWNEGSSEPDKDVVGDGGGPINAEVESLGAVIDEVLITLPVLPNPRFLVKVVSEEPDAGGTLPGSDDKKKSPLIAMAAATEPPQVILPLLPHGDILPERITILNR